MRALLALSLLLPLLATSARAEPKWCENGADYVRYCAACHGEKADGNGPAASALDPRPPALTSLHKKFGDPLSTELVAFLLGTAAPRAHGTSAMPVWGTAFGKAPLDQPKEDLILWRIVGHLDCIQTDK